MPHLPIREESSGPPETDCKRFLRDIERMRRGRSGGRPAPHKPLLLLTVLGMAERHQLSLDRIEYTEGLKREFDEIFDSVRGPGNYRNPAQPFWHLRTSPFWGHKLRPGKEREYAETTTSGWGEKRLQEIIEYAYLADYARRALAERECWAAVEFLLKTILDS